MRENSKGFILIVILLIVAKEVYGKSYQKRLTENTSNRANIYDLNFIISMLKLKSLFVKKPISSNAKILVLMKLAVHLAKQKVDVEKDRNYWRLRQG
jgi:hypothetical protein